MVGSWMAGKEDGLGIVNTTAELCGGVSHSRGNGQVGGWVAPRVFEEAQQAGKQGDASGGQQGVQAGGAEARQQEEEQQQQGRESEAPLASAASAAQQQQQEARGPEAQQQQRDPGGAGGADGVTLPLLAP